MSIQIEDVDSTARTYKFDTVDRKQIASIKVPNLNEIKKKMERHHNEKRQESKNPKPVKAMIKSPDKQIEKDEESIPAALTRSIKQNFRNAREEMQKLGKNQKIEPYYYLVASFNDWLPIKMIRNE